MELVNSYLIEVGQYLPKAQRAEVLGELRGSLEDQVIDHAEAAGRAPQREDELAVLGALGHPVKVAGEFREQRYLIGPELYTTYLRTLKIVLVVALSITFAVSLVAAYVSSWETTLLGTLWSLLEVCVWVVAVVTGVFIALEYSGEKLSWYDRWEPKSLDPGSTSIVDREDVVSNLVTEGVFLLWWNDAIGFQSIPVELSEAWSFLFWPLNVIVSLAFLSHVYVLVRGVWHRRGLVLEVALDAMLLAIMAALVFEPALLDVAGGGEDVRIALERSLRVTIVVIAGFTVWDVWVALRQLRGMRDASIPAGATRSAG